MIVKGAFTPKRYYTDMNPPQPFLPAVLQLAQQDEVPNDGQQHQSRLVETFTRSGFTPWVLKSLVQRNCTVTSVCVPQVTVCN